MSQSSCRRVGVSARPIAEQIDPLALTTDNCVNAVLRGWGNYFRLSSVSKAYRSVDSAADMMAVLVRNNARWKRSIPGYATGEFRSSRDLNRYYKNQAPER
jgi:Group II intron, maturase-specific domain